MTGRCSGGVRRVSESVTALPAADLRFKRLCHSQMLVEHRQTLGCIGCDSLVIRHDSALIQFNGGFVAGNLGIGVSLMKILAVANTEHQCLGVVCQSCAV